jgi:hypothetical protein
MTRALQKLPGGDFEFHVDVDLPSESRINIDEATDLIFKENDWPLTGGPSGRGWSYYSVAGRCAQLFRRTYDVPAELATKKVHGSPLQIGALFHTLEALYYGAGLGEAYVLPEMGGTGRAGGLVSEELKLAGRRKRWQVPPTAADDFLRALRRLIDSEAPSPDPAVVNEAERLFDLHTNWWGDREDVTPLGVEVFARHPQLGYTCRYDMIGRVGPNDPVLPKGVVIFEKKCAKWINEQYLSGWSMDGEILGQLLCWKVSGMEEMFGPLEAIVIDIVSKAKTPDCRRVVLPPTLPSVATHAKWVRWLDAEIQMWRATGAYPQRFGNCWGRYGLCEEFGNCANGLTGDEK